MITFQVWVLKKQFKFFNSNKGFEANFITRLGTKLDIKGVKFETGLEIDVSEKGEKEKQ